MIQCQSFCVLWVKSVFCPRKSRVADRAKHQAMKYQTDRTSADELLPKADYSNVVGDRKFEPKNRPSAPTFYETMEMRYQATLINEYF